MKKQDFTLIIVTSIFSAIFALIISLATFNSTHKKISVPQVEKISSDFPDVQNDPNLKAIFNPSALDPTQTITIGNGENGNPFNQ